jgi:hypothetical protein
VRLQVDVDSHAGMSVSWHPDSGKSLAMPRKNSSGDVVIVDRLRWGRAPVATLSDVHSDIAVISAFSPNGAAPPARHLAVCSTLQIRHFLNQLPLDARRGLSGDHPLRYIPWSCAHFSSVVGCIFQVWCPSIRDNVVLHRAPCLEQSVAQSCLPALWCFRAFLLR